MLKPSFKILARNWWPVIVWLGVIRLESTDYASAQNTSTVLYTVIAEVAPHVDPSFVSQLDEVLRKTGHFLGYGILGGLVFLALRNTRRDWLRPILPRAWGSCFRDLWKLDWAIAGIIAAATTATADEIHQTFIPSRTGRWQDVLLDTAGAIVLQVIIYAVSRRIFRNRRNRALEAALAPAKVQVSSDSST